MFRSSNEAKGMGVAYHPLLLRWMAQGRLPADFVEAPLEMYIDPARASLLDPDFGGLRRIAVEWPIAWRSSAFSLGSVEDPADPSCSPVLLRRFAKICEATRPAALIETIGFRRLDGRDFGRARRLPQTAIAADWLSAHCRRLRDAVGIPVLLQLGGGFDNPVRGDMQVIAFLERIAERTDCDFVIDVAHIEGLARETELDARETVARLARLPVAILTLSGEREAEWDLLAVALEAMHPSAIVLRRVQNLYPLDEIVAHLQRASAALDRPRAAASPLRSAPAAPACEPTAAAELRAWQAAAIETAYANPDDLKFAAWRNWRRQLDETHKGHEIRKFLSA
ncbi:MAG: DUF692 family multinuclear iron-containing protein [Roseiarcus sp.]